MLAKYKILFAKYKILKEETGQAMVLFAVAAVVLFGMAGFAIDIGKVAMQKSEMQNAADAAALAGAQDLLDSGAENTAQVYAELNGVSEADIEINPTNTDPKKIEVVCTRTIQYSFARILGFTDTTVETRAVAGLSGVNSVTGAVPLGVESQTLEYGETYLLKNNAGSGQHQGNFGCLAFGGNGANVYGNNLKYGYDDVLSVGDTVDTEPGNMAGKTSAGISYRINQDPTATFETVQKDSPRIVIVPMVNTMDVHGRKEVTIVGFAVFFIENTSTTGHGNNANASISGKFMEMFVPNSTAGAETSYGAYNLRLIE